MAITAIKEPNGLGRRKTLPARELRMKATPEKEALQRVQGAREGTERGGGC